MIAGALESQGCALDLERHLICDICAEGKNEQNQGGYDDEHNQIFLCANNSGSKIHGVLVRNLIEMFDRCVHKVDNANLDHLACIEVRKANLASCNFLNYYSRPESSFGVQGQHSNCVRHAAVRSLKESKFVEDEVKAKEAVDRVFPKCYADLEPFGRRARNAEDMNLAFKERYLFGYY